MAVSGESSPAALVSGKKLGGPGALPKCYDVKKRGETKYGGVFVGAGVFWPSYVSLCIDGYGCIHLYLLLMLRSSCALVVPLEK